MMRKRPTNINLTFSIFNTYMSHWWALQTFSLQGGLCAYILLIILKLCLLKTVATTSFQRTSSNPNIIPKPKQKLLEKQSINTITTKVCPNKSPTATNTCHLSAVNNQSSGLSWRTLDKYWITLWLIGPKFCGHQLIASNQCVELIMLLILALPLGKRA